MIGSETFIIVALRWIENKTPSSAAQRARLANYCRSFGRAEVVTGHMGDIGFGRGGPGTHPMRVRPGIVLDRGRRAAVGVALAQDWIYRAALDPVVASADVALVSRDWFVRVVRHRVASLSQFG